MPCFFLNFIGAMPRATPDLVLLDGLPVTPPFGLVWIRLWIFVLAPVAETGFSHRLAAYKIVEHFFGLSYRKISGHNQVKNIFFRISNIFVPCPHAQFRGRTVIKKLWTFFEPWGRDRSQSPPCWIFRLFTCYPLVNPPRCSVYLIFDMVIQNKNSGISSLHLA